MERLQPDVKLALGGGVGVAVAQEGGEGGQFADVTQDRVACTASKRTAECLIWGFMRSVTLPGGTR
jgi:hypothetical protein